MQNIEYKPWQIITTGWSMAKLFLKDKAPKVL